MLKRTLQITLALITLNSQAAHADSCVAENQRCLETQTLTIAGVEVQNVCVKVERTESCTRDAPVNECTTLEPITVATSPLASGQCELVSETCLRSVAGVCDRNERTYNCWNGPTIAAPARLTDRTYHNLEENIVDNCSALEGDANCALLDTVVTEGFATRPINGQDITRAWWSQERQYDCTNNLFEDDCQPFDDAPFCQPTGEETCLDYAADGSCEYTERVYNCESNTEFETSCEAINTCVGENCLNIEPEISTDYPVAAAWLTFLDDAAKGNQCGTDSVAEEDDDADEEGSDYGPGSNGNGDTGDNVTVVSSETASNANGSVTTTVVYSDGTTVATTVDGDVTTIVTTTGGDGPPTTTTQTFNSDLVEGDVTVADCETGFLEGGASEPEVFAGESMACFADAFANCCRNPGSSYCGQEPLDLKARIDAGAAHYLGSRCTSRVLGICLSWSYDFCTYKSKFGRVFQEQVDLQTGAQFQWRQTPECPPLTIAQLEDVDPTTMELDEVFGDMLDQADEPVQDLVIEFLETEMGLYNGQVQDTLE